MQSLSRTLAALLFGHASICGGAENPPARGLFVDHFIEEALSLAAMLELDIGGDSGPLSGWLTRGTDAQKKNKAVIAGIVNYCARQAFIQIGDTPRDLENYPSQAAAARESYNRGTLAAWRICETSESDAYRRVIIGNKLQKADQQIIEACTAIPDGDSYAAIERCIDAETQIRK